MSAAAELIETARTAGVGLTLKGEKLHVKAERAPSADLLAELKAHRDEVLAALRAKDAALMERCREACRGLPVSATALLAELSEADKAAMRSGDPDELKALRALAECLAERAKPTLDARIEKAYRWLQAELAKRPERNRETLVIDPDADPVLIAVAVRGAGLATLKVEKARYQGREFELLELIDRVSMPQSTTTGAAA
jgi:hypothetical protein